MLLKKTLLFAILVTTACQKEGIPTLDLPPITMSGENTLGFLLDDQVWANHGRRCTITGCQYNQVEAHLYRQPNGDLDLEVTAAFTLTVDTIDQAFYFYTTNVTTTGTFPLDSTLQRGMTFVASRYTQWYKEYKSNDFHPATLTITRFDTTNLIIAGTFSGVLYNPADLRDSVSIREGRFDAQLDFPQ